MACAACRYSEGTAERRAGGWVLVLWCLAKGGRARARCESFAAEDADDDA